MDIKRESLEIKDYRKAKKTVEVSVGESVRIIRELQGLSQNGLSRLTNIPQSTISGIENGRIQIGVERAKVLAKALKCHPAVLVSPGKIKEKFLVVQKSRKRNKVLE